MDYDALLRLPPYGLPCGEKRRIFGAGLTELTRRHRDGCPPYDRLLARLGYAPDAEYAPEEVPMLPVTLFKDQELCSVPRENVFKILTSSGTGGQRVSRICLDAETAARQQATLCRIVSDLIGPRRLPMLIVDSRQALRDRRQFSARGAGILGFSLFGSPIYYALDGDMELDLDGVRDFLARHRGERVLVFGFTYLVWIRLCRELEQRGERLALDSGVLIHGGGWKKLEHEAVSRREFRARLRMVTGLDTVADYYGMAEQTGCVCLECPCGHFHTSSYSDIIFRRPGDFSLCARGEPGIIQVLSLLPGSYPGHSLLTEDMGILLGEDDCPCGRLGKYFSVIGRIPKAEVRGCSDTYGG